MVDYSETTFIEWLATPTRLCFRRVGRRRRSPICRSQRAVEQDSLRVFASFKTSEWTHNSYVARVFLVPTNRNKSSSTRETVTSSFADFLMLKRHAYSRYMPRWSGDAPACSSVSEIAGQNSSVEKQFVENCWKQFVENCWFAGLGTQAKSISI